MNGFDIMGAVFLFLLIGPMLFDSSRRDEPGETNDSQ
jgi:hypothetical protein